MPRRNGRYVIKSLSEMFEYHAAGNRLDSTDVYVTQDFMKELNEWLDEVIADGDPDAVEKLKELKTTMSLAEE
jgi:uncharacterized membrane protein (DUF106 family)